MPTYYWIALAFIFVGLCFKFIFDNQNSSTTNTENLPYAKKYTIMSEPERILFEKILKVIPSNYFIYPQYNLDKIFYVKGIENKSKKTILNNKINRKSVDYLIINQTNQSPVLAIELDDSSHDKPDRQERDIFVNKVCQSGQLPILHLTSCNIDEINLRRKISEKIDIFNLS